MPSLRRRRPVLAVLLAIACASAACAPEDPPAAPRSPSPDAAVPAVGAGLVVVLPPADRLAAAEREHVRRAVDRAVAATLPAAVDPATVVVLEPADSTVVVDTVERAVRRVGPGGTVCVLGAGVRERIAPVLALYPATRACLLPATPVEGDGHLALDVDLESLGRELGAAARDAAGEGTVLVLDAGDAMLDRRWRTAITTRVLDPDRTGASGRLHTVRTAAELLGLIEAQDALLAEGIVPGSAEALAPPAGEDVAPPEDEDGPPPARFLRPVAVVVLDASPEAAAIVPALGERGMLVIGPASLLDAAEVRQDTVVMSWQVRWHLRLAVLLDAALAGSGSTLAIDDEEPVVVVPGPAGR